jgi:hypothetical protein
MVFSFEVVVIDNRTSGVGRALGHILRLAPGACTFLERKVSWQDACLKWGVVVETGTKNSPKVKLILPVTLRRCIEGRSSLKHHLASFILPYVRIINFELRHSIAKANNNARNSNFVEKLQQSFKTEVRDGKENLWCGTE